MSRTDDLSELSSRFPKLAPLSTHIGSRLAGNYSFGTRATADYRVRLEAGIRVATETPDQALNDVIATLIRDRHEKKGQMDDSVHSYRDFSLLKKRALILALWSVRIPTAKTDVVNVIDEKVYMDARYMPPGTAGAGVAAVAEPSRAVEAEGDCYQPKTSDFEKQYERLSVMEESVDEERIRMEIEKEVTSRGERLCPDWWAVLLSQVKIKAE